MLIMCDVNLFKKVFWIIAYLLLSFSFSSYSQIPRTINHDTVSFYKFNSEIKALKDSFSIQKKMANIDSTKNFEFCFGNIKYNLNAKLISSVYDIQHLSISEIIENIFNPLSLKFNGLALDEGFMKIEVFKYDHSDYIQVYYSRVLESSFLIKIKKNLKLENYIANRLIESLDSLNIIQFTFSEEEESKPIASLSLGMYGSNFLLNRNYELVNIYGENKSWTREVPLKLTRKRMAKDYIINDNYSFQFIEINGRHILKADTMSISVKSFLSYYINKPEYEILHLIDFKTKDRFIKFNIDWGQCDTCGKIIDLKKIDVNEFIHFYEYCPSYDALIELNIGEIRLGKYFKFIDKSWFLNNIKKGVRINLPEGDFTPIYMEFILFDENGDNLFVRTDNTNNENLNIVWEQLANLSGLYIQNIVFSDKTGKKTRIPNTFLYFISK